MITEHMTNRHVALTWCLFRYRKITNLKLHEMYELNLKKLKENPLGGRYREAIELATHFEHLIWEVFIGDEASAFYFMEALINRMVTDKAFKLGTIYIIHAPCFS